jgi:hypothetical protein
VGSDWFYVVGVVGIDASEVGAVDRLVGFRRNGVNVECFREINIGRLWWLYVGVLVLFLFVCVLCGCRWSCPLVRQTWCVCWFFLVVVLQSGSTEFMLSVSIPRTIALFLMAVQLGSLTWCWSP